MSEIIQSSKYYSSIDKLPLHLFWDICVSGNRQLLVTSGHVSDEKLEAIWEDIIYEYTDIVSPETNRKIKNKKRIATLHAKYDCVYSGLHLLKAYAGFELNDERVEKQQKICDILNSFFPGLKIDYNNKKTLLQKLKSAEARAKNWVITIADLKKQAKAENVKEQESTKYIDLQNMLTASNTYWNLTFTEHDLTTLAFATYYKRMNDDIEQKQASLNNNGRIRKH